MQPYVLPCTKTAVPGSCGTQVATSRARSLAYVLLTWGIIVAHFLASDYLYVKDFPHWQIYAVLGALWLAIYKAFDNTRQVRSAPVCLAAGLNLNPSVLQLAVQHTARLWGKRGPGCYASLPGCSAMTAMSE